MKKIYLLSLFIGAIAFTQAQSQAHTFGCLAGELSQKQYEKHPELLIAKAQLDSFTKEYIRLNRANGAQRANGQYVIPVVFHILHNAGDEMLSDQRIFTEISNWNEYTGMTNAELSTIVPAFDTLIGDPQVQFRLAQIDPDGHCTNGIERIYTQATYQGDDNAKMNPWPREKYLNVWLVSKMSSANANALAYAYYPSSVANYVNNDIIDGIIAMAEAVGLTPGMRDYAWNRPTLAHESGHWMNLEHVWGNDNDPGKACGDDGVDDTPITKGTYGGCPLTLAACTPPIIENTQNIMNYSNCHVMFTKGQVARMHAALNSSVSGRLHIWSQANLLATGTVDSVAYPNPNSCAIPVAEFAVNSRFVCTGQPVKFTDASWNGEVQNRTWTFPADADLGTTTNVDEQPVATFYTPGWKEVTLLVGNNNGSSQKVKSMVYVADASAPVIAAPYFETFEDANQTRANWQTYNDDNNNTSLQYYTGAGHHSNACFKANLYDATYDGDIDELTSPSFDLSGVDPSQMTLSFDYSFATYDVKHMSDSLAAIAVYGTTDCGAHWQRLCFNTGGFNLFNAGTVTSNYAVQQPDEYWQKVSVTLGTNYQTYGVNFKFQVMSARGANNFYIDNINVGQAEDRTGIITRKSTVGSMAIVPNPSHGSATLRLVATESTEAVATMYDMAGREIMTIFSGQLDKGLKNIPFNTENIATGIYVVKVSDGKATTQQRFVKM